MFTLHSQTKQIIPDPNKLMIKEFKVLWDRDKTKSKSKALEDLSYIYYICDFKSPYVNGYSAKDLPIIVKNDFITREDWKVDKAITLAISKYKELQETKTIKLFKAADNAVNKLIEYFESVDLSERTTTVIGEDGEVIEVQDDKVHDIAAKVMANLQKVSPVATALEEARKKVEKEILVKASTVKGSGRLTSREMPKNR